MNYLAIETSVTSATIAFHDGHVVSERRVGNDGVGASGAVLAEINALLRECDAQERGLDGVVVGVGPGSFTGVRVACAVAQGLGTATGVALFPVVSIDALAAGVPGEHVLAVLDARMGEVYWAAYSRSGGSALSRHGEVQCSTADRIELPDEKTTWAVCGSGYMPYRDRLDGRWSLSVTAGAAVTEPTAGLLLSYFLDRRLSIKDVPPEALTPLYVRNKVALTTVERQMIRPAS